MMAESSLSRPLPSPLVPPLGDNARVIEMIAEVTGERPEEIRGQLACEERDLGCHHRQDVQRAGLTPHVWDERLETFYRESRAWLPAHVAWNRRPEKLRMREWIGGYLAKQGDGTTRVLVMGDGSGFDSLYLSLCGYEVTYCEPCAPCVAFARRLFFASGQQVRVVTRDTDLAESAFDAVVCLDVLEHHCDPPVFVKQLAGYLRPGGCLVVSAPFFFVTPHNPTHLRANRKYSGDLARLYSAHDLHVADGRFFWNPIVLCKPTVSGVVVRRSWLWVGALRYSGILLAIGRFWSFPHNWMAIRAFTRADPRWLRELDTPCGQEAGPVLRSRSK
jgi:SAM-dependent methyltransferase